MRWRLLEVDLWCTSQCRNKQRCAIFGQIASLDSVDSQVGPSEVGFPPTGTEWWFMALGDLKALEPG